MASSLVCLGEENDADYPENPPSGNTTSSEGRIVLICDDTSGCASLLQRKGDSPFADVTAMFLNTPYHTTLSEGEA